MTDQHIAYAVLHDLYGLDVQAIEPLDQYVFSWRTIVRATDAAGHTWLLRLLALPDAEHSMRNTARVLEWLEQRSYPAPRIRKTIDGSVVGRYENWNSILLTFVPGCVVPRNTASLARFAAQLGHLHALALPANVDLPHSRCHPHELAATTHALATYHTRLPRDWQPVVETLCAATRRLGELAPETLAHGDCWYANAIDHDGQITLIDWDCAGAGIAVLDLGNLLLTSHFDLARPLELHVDHAVVRQLVAAYQHTRPLAAVERRLAADAAYFLIAFQLGSYLRDHTTIDCDDLVLRKLRARFEASRQIACAIRDQGSAWRA